VKQGDLRKEAANTKRAHEGLDGGHGRKLERHAGLLSCSAS
jgi:hypothetical protein